MSTETTVHFLGRCQCGFALRTEEGSAQTVERYRDMSTPAVPYRMGAQHYVRCPEGHKPFKLYRVEGEFSEAFECDARCENAKGHTCKCSCGGMNHGKAYAVQPTEVHHVENLGAAIANAHERYGVTGIEVGGQSFSNDELRGLREEERDALDGMGYDKAEQRVIEEQREDIRHPKQHIGVIGEKVYFDGILKDKREINDSVLHVFVAEVRSDPPPVNCTIGYLIGEAKVEWWMPASVPDPGFEIGKGYALKAKVKRHDDNPKWGKATVVTYLEEV